ncbi:right-handed parallel beta-helix repeat-containing protein [Actinoplanes sp. ATCC 53533]|uniref:right-handed parallel beta-helix repeat-containing protein n=1 Tax=Actinoplanes sp. ATCC 53533 TaxID=1288362 RepID=UPI00268947B4
MDVITPSGVTGGATDRAAIQGALTPGGAQVLLAPGDFYIDEPIVLYSNQRLIGSGAGATKIHQVGTGHGITSTTAGSINYVTIAGLTLVGTKAPDSCGIRLVPSPTQAKPGELANITNITIEDCVTKGWGDCGVYLAAPIASRITRVQSADNTGDGFYVTTAQLGVDTSTIKAATSLVFEACYALGNTKNGFELDTVSYSSLTGCACDHGRRGYALYDCRAVTLTSCGAESFSEAGFLLQSSTSCSLFGAYTFGGSKVGISVTRSTAHQTIGGAVQSKPTVDTQNFIRTEAGTSTVLWGVSRPATTGSSTNTLDGQVTNLDGSA